MKKKILLLSLSMALATGLAAASGASEGAHHIDWSGVLGKVINSIVLFGGLTLLLRKPLIEMLSRKGATIRADVEEREKNLAIAESRLREIEDRIARAATEVEKIKSDAEVTGKAELSRLEEAGRREAERIVALGEEEIRQRADAAVRRIKGRVADLAIERFRGDFAKELDAAAQQKIIERNIDACAKLHEGK